MSSSSHVRHTDDTPPSARRALLVASVVIGAEALVLIGLAVAELAQVSGARIGVGVGAAVLLAAYGVGQVVALVLLWRRTAAARGPLVLTQLIQLGLAWNTRDDAAWIPLTLLVSALVALAALLSPPVTRLLVDEPAE